VKRLVPVTALAILLAACGHPLIPASALHNSRPSRVPIVRSPPTLGVDLYASHAFTPGLVREDGWRSLVYIKRVLHAQSVGIVWNLYSPGTTSTAVERTGISLSPPEVAVLTRQATALGMSVEYRPLIRVGAQWKWEGLLRPADRRAWFDSLFKTEQPYLRVAQRLHVTEFVAGTELHRLSGAADWQWFLSRAHSVYGGMVSYAAFQVDYVHHPPILPPTERYGVDPYPHIQLRATASIDQLTSAWIKYFRHVPPAILNNSVMQEVSIPALIGAYHHPELWNMQGKPDQMVQARWFTAACKVVVHFHMRGIYFYEVNILDSPAHPLSFSAFFEGKLAAGAVRGCLRIFHPGTVSPRPG
jgi:hypothetical protein